MELKQIWTTDINGYLQPTQFSLNKKNDLHCQALKACEIIVTKLSDVESIHFRGSALETIKTEWIFDIDIVVVFKDKSYTQNSKIISQIVNNQVKSSIPFDIGIVYRNKICQPISTDIQLILAFRSFPLYGSYLWETVPRIKPDKILAKKFAINFFNYTDVWLEHIIHYNKIKVLKFLPWFYKRILRIGSIIALENSIYTRDITDCTKLLSEKFPWLSSTIGSVEHSLYNFKDLIIDTEFREFANLYLEIRKQLLFEMKL